jgi:aminopeptidase N
VPGRSLAPALLLLTVGAGGLAAQADTSSPGHTPSHYDITLVRSDTGPHVLGEVETNWRLGSALPIVVDLDSSFRVVRVFVDGKPNTRISRTQFARGTGDVLIPHEKPAGDSLTTRIRYHGVPRGGLRAGPNQYGARTLVAEGMTADLSLWLPVPEPDRRTASVTFHVQADSGERVIAAGVLVKVDTLAYGHTRWDYQLDQAIPLSAIAVAAGPYAADSLPRAACATPCARVSVWSWSRDSAFAAGGPFRRAAGMLDFFSRLLGPFPYPALTHVEAAFGPRPVSGASVILYPESSFRDGTLDEAAVAQATARQWLRPGAPDSVAAYLAGLWRSDADGKAKKNPDLARVRGFLRSP